LGGRGSARCGAGASGSSQQAAIAAAIGVVVFHRLWGLVFSLVARLEFIAHETSPPRGKWVLATLDRTAARTAAQGRDRFRDGAAIFGRGARGLTGLAPIARSCERTSWDQVAACLARRTELR
jgi:hypothetical protein